MSDNPIDKVKETVEGVKRTDELYIYYADIISALPRQDRHHAMLEMLVIRHRDNEASCKLAWELYLAGTGQTNETFSGTAGDPIEEVRESRKALLGHGLGINKFSALPAVVRHSYPVQADNLRDATKSTARCGPECDEAHTYQPGTCRMFTFGSGYAPGTREQ